MSNSDEIVNKALNGVFKTNDRSIDNVKRDLGSGVRKSASKKRNLNDITLSTTVILVEVAASDEAFQLSEYDTIAEGLRQLYGTGREDAKKYINQALILRSSLTGNSRHLELLRDALSDEEKLRVARVIDEIISADGQEDPYEIFLRQRYRRALGISEIKPVIPSEEEHLDRSSAELEQAVASNATEPAAKIESAENRENSVSAENNTEDLKADDTQHADEFQEPTKSAAPRETQYDILSKRIDEELL